VAAHDPNPRTLDDDSLFKGQNWLSAKIVDFICAVTPKCVEVTRLLSESMDRPLPWWTRFKLRLHFLMCTYCKRYGEHLRVIRKAGHLFCEHSHEASNEQMPAEAKERIKQVLHDAAVGE
jgi:hypothetical protein